VHTILTFADHLRLIEERSTAFRAAIAAAPSLDLPVLTSDPHSAPDRTLFELVQHVGMGRRRTAAVVAAGPADAPPEMDVREAGAGAPRERDALMTCWTESIEQLMNALREAGPDRACWTWWDDSPSPQTAGAWARRQVPEIAVYTHDAQSTVGAPEPIPHEVALDGFDDCQFTLCATTVAWPHAPAVVDYHATEGRSWRLRLDGAGARVTRLGIPAAGVEQGAAYASARGTASDLVLFFYGRIPLESLQSDGDVSIFDKLVAWDPSE